MKKKYTPAVLHALSCLGRNIQVARKRRRMPVADFAARIGVSVPTVVRLEKGDPGVSTGCLARALRALGEMHRLEELLDVATDDAGLAMAASELPKRIRKRRVHVGDVRPVPAEAGDMPAVAEGTGTAF